VVDDAREEARGSAAATEGFSAERIAEIGVRFRKANDQIEQRALEFDADARVPFLCECSDAHRTDVVLLSLAAAQGFAYVVETREGYAIVETTGAAAKAVIAQTHEPAEKETK
jgi:hypothetical protein